MLKQAIYDNEETQRRELWRDGDMAAAITVDALGEPVFLERYKQHKLFSLLIDVGPWVAGEIRGDKAAMEATC